ncbi:Ig-like domain-containing protein [Lacinutrix sp. 5H-3-7-4]|uniref:Ig-like domain-containing protein n=1 Tax=Lacinutrix sp. (strain 5H-3-7-4) TaxID=983544 RepID=UPI00059DE58B|nr:Ig-like domain-containing protein [Lacinutrix sp. 5H-3-7-4]
MKNSTLSSNNWLNSILLFIAFLLITPNVFADGTKQVMPNQNNGTALYIVTDTNFGGSLVGPYLGTSESQRVYFTIADASTENLYFGLQARMRNSFAGGNNPLGTNFYYQIFNEAGVAQTSPILFGNTSGENGFIETYNEAVAGPNIGGATPTGYTPLSFNPTANGNYYIALYSSYDGGTTVATGGNTLNGLDQLMFLPYFDFTVSTAANVQSEGRIWSRKWSFITYLVEDADNDVNTPDVPNPTEAASFEGNFFAYTDDQVILEVDFAEGFRPFGYQLAMNRFGVVDDDSDPSNSFIASRTSKTYGLAAPANLDNGYQVFIASPDQNVFIPSPEPSPVVANGIVGCPGSYFIPVTLQLAQDTAVLLEFNGTPGYQSGTTDVLLESFENEPGEVFIPWDGNDGLGTPVTSSTISVSVNSFIGRTNVPMIDAELNLNGLSVTGVAPNTNSRLLRWDDRDIIVTGTVCDGSNQLNNLTTVDGTFHRSGLLDGIVGPAHAWSSSNPDDSVPAISQGGNDSDNLLCNDFGNTRVINTWTYGATVETEPVTLDLPNCDGDTDDDGIDDITDLDDDNDGILDTDELNCSPGFVDLGQTFNDNTSDPVIVNNAYVYNSTNVDMTFEIEGSAVWAGGVSNQTAAGVSGSYVNTQPSNTNFVNGDVGVYTFTFSQTVYNIKFKFGGLDNEDRADFIASESGFNVPVQLTDINLAGNGTFSGQSVVSSANSGNAPNNSVQLEIAAANQIIIRVAKDNGNTGNVTLQFYELEYCLPINSDTDGAPNHLDNDSDADGCPDALEGSGLYEASTLEGDGSLGDNVDANGIPETSGSISLQQTDVSSTDSNVSSAECVPVALDDTGSSTAPVSDANTVSVNVVSNDTDSNGTIDVSTVDLDPSTAGIQDTFTNVDGTYTVDANGVVTFDPNAGLTTDPTPITYTVNDNDGNTSNEASITITYGEGPVALGDSATTGSDEDVVIDITLNDTDGDGTIDDGTVDLDPNTPGQQGTFTVPGEGTYTDNGDGTVTFDPEPDFDGVSTINYTVNDNDGNVSNTAPITVTVEDAPVALDDTGSSTAPVSDANTVSVNVVSNDTDSDGTIDVSTVDLDPSTAGIQDTFTNVDGTYTVDANGVVTFDPNAGLTTDPTPITYTVNDNDGNTSNEASITITYGEGPVAVDDNASTTPDTNVTFPITDNDSDPSAGGSIDVTSVDLDPNTPGQQGTFTVPGEGTYTDNGDGTVTFDPEPGFTGVATPIDYTVNDNDGNPSNIATITVTVASCPSPIDSDGDGLTDCEETTGIDDPSTVNVPVGVTDPSDACDPIEGSDLTDSDGDGLTDCEETTGNDNPNTAGVPVGITDPNNPCDPFTDGSGCTPIAVDDNASTTPDTNVTFPITDNDSDPSAGGSIDVTSVDLDPNTPGQQGTFTVPGEGTYTDNGDGTVTFDPDPGFTGVSTPIDYTVNDNDGNPSNIATITVTVASCPSPIDSDGDGLTDCEETTGIDDPSTVNVPVGVTDPSDACDPIEGSDLTDSDGDGLTDCEETTGNDNPNTAGVPVGITDPNNPCDPFTDGSGCTPIAVDDNASTIEDAPVALDDTGSSTAPVSDANTVSVNVVSNDTDSDGTIDVSTVDLDPSTAGIQDTFTNVDGTYTVDANGVVTFDPNAGLTTDPTPITYTVNDNDGNTSNEASITITYGEGPVALGDSATTGSDEDVVIDITLNDTDGDGTIDDGTVDLDPNTPGQQGTFTVPGEGTYTDNGDGTVTFDPEPDFDGVSTINYTVNDNDGNVSNTAPITVTVEDAPVALDDTGSSTAPVSDANTVSVNVVSNDTDSDGTIDVSTVDLDPSTAGIQDTFTNVDGTYTVDANGVVTFDPNAGLTTDPTPITYTVNDNDGNTSNEASITITYGEGPVALGDSATTGSDEDVVIDITLNDTDGDGTIDDGTVDLDPNTPGQQGTFTVPGEGTYTDNGDGTVTFDPEPDFDGVSTINYTVNDNDGNVSNTAPITVTVEDAPVALDDTGSSTAPVSDTNTVSVNVVSNDTDSDGTIDVSTVDLDPSTAGIQDTFTNVDGTYTVDANGVVTFDPNAGLTTDPTPITYTVNDNDGQMETEQ